MGCGCGQSQNPQPVSADAPNPNLGPNGQPLAEAWWQANPAPVVVTPAVPMPQ